jgi:predicted cupin superfamily sugar epimerase
MKMKDSRYWIKELGLERHPEGGYYKETYRSGELITPAGLPERFHGPRCFSTAIYFLLSGQEVSHLHRIKSDEIWHFYEGDTLSIHVIEPDGKYWNIRLGQDIASGGTLQGVVPAGCWFGAKVEDPGSYCLAGCTVAPGFEFEDFEMADRDTMIEVYPHLREIIDVLTEP